MPEPEIKGLGVLNRTPSLVEIFQDSNFQNPKLPIKIQDPYLCHIFEYMSQFINIALYKINNFDDI